MVSSVLFFIAEALQPSIVNRSILQIFHEPSVRRNFFFSQSLFLLAFALYSCSAISIYKLLSYTRDHRPAFWAMVFSVIGVGLSMPSLGINAMVLPLVAQLYLANELETLKIYLALQTMPWSLILRLGGYVLVFGIALFSWVILRNKNFPKWSAILFLAGWIVFIAPIAALSQLYMILAGLLISIGGN